MMHHPYYYNHDSTAATAASCGQASFLTHDYIDLVSSIQSQLTAPRHYYSSSSDLPNAAPAASAGRARHNLDAIFIPPAGLTPAVAPIASPLSTAVLQQQQQQQDPFKFDSDADFLSALGMSTLPSPVLTPAYHFSSSAASAATTSAAAAPAVAGFPWDDCESPAVSPNSTSTTTSTSSFADLLHYNRRSPTATDCTYSPATMKTTTPTATATSTTALPQTVDPAKLWGSSVSSYLSPVLSSPAPLSLPTQTTRHAERLPSPVSPNLSLFHRHEQQHDFSPLPPSSAAQCTLPALSDITSTPSSLAVVNTEPLVPDVVPATAAAAIVVAPPSAYYYPSPTLSRAGKGSRARRTSAKSDLSATSSLPSPLLSVPVMSLAPSALAPAPAPTTFPRLSPAGDTHDDPTGEHPDGTGDKLFVCRFAPCCARFSRNHDLKRHERIHTGEKRWTCTECGRAFGRRDALTRHTSAPGGRCKAVHGKRGGARKAAAAATSTDAQGVVERLLDEQQQHQQQVGLGLLKRPLDSAQEEEGAKRYRHAEDENEEEDEWWSSSSHPDEEELSDLYDDDEDLS